MYLTDNEMVQALYKCIKSLNYNFDTGKSGLIFVKESVLPENKLEIIDNTSFYRHKSHFNIAFEV